MNEFTKNIIRLILRGLNCIWFIFSIFAAIDPINNPYRILPCNDLTKLDLWIKNQDVRLMLMIIKDD